MGRKANNKKKKISADLVQFGMFGLTLIFTFIRRIEAMCVLTHIILNPP